MGGAGAVMAFPTITEEVGWFRCGPWMRKEESFGIPVAPTSFLPMVAHEKDRLDSALEAGIWLEAQKLLDNRNT